MEISEIELFGLLSQGGSRLDVRYAAARFDEH